MATDMADLDTLSRALKRAHAAGDTAAAKRFASEIKALQGSAENYTGVMHPEFDGSKIPGYNPQTGMVERPTGRVESALSGAADAVTFGFGDELAAGAVSGIESLRGNDQPYDRTLAQIRADQRAAQDQNPKSYLGGQVGGAIAQALATRGAGFFPNASSIAGKMGGGMLTGAAYGGAHGAGAGEGMGDRATQALKEGAFGAAIGATAPVVAAGASRAYEAARNAVLGNRIARQAGASPEALRMLGNVLDADGTRGPVGAANMARAGQDAMLADAGPNARAILDTAIQRGGPGAVEAQNAIAQRTARAAGAATSALDNTLGAPQGVTAARTAIRTGSAAARGNAYDAAYSAPINYADPRGQALEQLVRGRVPGDIVRQANRLMQLGGDESQQILARVADDGSVAFERLPDVRQLDYITRALNNAAESGDGAGALGGQTPMGRAYQGLASEIRRTLRDLVPEYGQALETAADPIRRSQGVELGSRLLSPSMTRDQVDEAVRGMSGPERAAVAQGVRSRIDDVMANVSRTVQDGDTPAREAVKAIRDLSSRANREKLSAVIGNQQAATLFDELDRVATSFDLRASVAQNSRTYARQATDARIGEMTAPGAVGTFMQGAPLKGTQRIAQALTGQTPQDIVRRQDGYYSELARLLTQPAAQSQAAFNAIGQMGQTDAATRLMAGRIARALAGTQTVYPSTMLLQDRVGK